MNRGYKFHNPEGLYFVSFAVVRWLKVFSRNTYKDLFLESVDFCQKNKGMEIHAWCVMTNHVHLIFRSVAGQKPELLLGDLKRFTSNSIVRAIQDNPKESQKNDLLVSFAKEAKKSSNVKHFQFWQHDNQPIELWSNQVIWQKINYVHQNPVVAGFVLKAEDYMYSSARDYAGEKGLLDDIMVFKPYGL